MSTSEKKETKQKLSVKELFAGDGVFGSHTCYLDGNIIVGCMNRDDGDIGWIITRKHNSKEEIHVEVESEDQEFEIEIY